MSIPRFAKDRGLNKIEYLVFWRGERPFARTSKYRSYLILVPKSLGIFCETADLLCRY